MTTHPTLAFLTGLAVGLLLGGVVGFLAYRNNRKRLAQTEADLRSAAATISSLRR